MILYLTVGLLGASSFMTTGSILTALNASEGNRVLITIVNILFPIAVLVTSVPVFAIVIRYNLVRGGFCSDSKLDATLRTKRMLTCTGWAFVWAAVVPWFSIIPFQTKGWLVSVFPYNIPIFFCKASGPGSSTWNYPFVHCLIS